MTINNSVKLIELNDCKCGKKPKRSVKKGFSKLGTAFYQEFVSCRSRICRRKEFFGGKSPNRAAKKWNAANPIRAIEAAE